MFAGSKDLNRWPSKTSYLLSLAWHFLLLGWPWAWNRNIARLFSPDLESVSLWVSLVRRYWFLTHTLHDYSLYKCSSSLYIIYGGRVRAHVFLQRVAVHEARLGVLEGPGGGAVLVAGAEDLQDLGELPGVQGHMLKQSWSGNRGVTTQLKHNTTAQTHLCVWVDRLR